MQQKKSFFLHDIVYSIQSISACIGLKGQSHEIEL